MTRGTTEPGSLDTPPRPAGARRGGGGFLRLAPLLVAAGCWALAGLLGLLLLFYYNPHPDVYAVDAFRLRRDLPWAVHGHVWAGVGAGLLLFVYAVHRGTRTGAMAVALALVVALVIAHLTGEVVAPDGQVPISEGAILRLFLAHALILPGLVTLGGVGLLVHEGRRILRERSAQEAAAEREPSGR